MLYHWITSPLHSVLPQPIKKEKHQKLSLHVLTPLKGSYCRILQINIEANLFTVSNLNCSCLHTYDEIMCKSVMSHSLHCLYKLKLN